MHEYTTITLPCPPNQNIFYQWVGWDQSCHRQPIQVLVGSMCTPLLQGNNIYQYKSAAIVVSITSDIVILIIDVAIISATPPLVLLFLWLSTPFLTLVMIPKWFYCHDTISHYLSSVPLLQLTPYIFSITIISIGAPLPPPYKLLT